ncbi:hypothetical protein ACA910_008790 [Epithemia clementina (nom. ined.)]
MRVQPHKHRQQENVASVPVAPKKQPSERSPKRPSKVKQTTSSPRRRDSDHEQERRRHSAPRRPSRSAGASRANVEHPVSVVEELRQDVSSSRSSNGNDRGNNGQEEAMRVSVNHKREVREERSSNKNVRSSNGNDRGNNGQEEAMRVSANHKREVRDERSSNKNVVDHHIDASEAFSAPRASPLLSSGIYSSTALIDKRASSAHKIFPTMADVFSSLKQAPDSWLDGAMIAATKEKSQEEEDHDQQQKQSMILPNVLRSMQDLMDNTRDVLETATNNILEKTTETCSSAACAQMIEDGDQPDRLSTSSNVEEDMAGDDSVMMQYLQQVQRAFPSDWFVQPSLEQQPTGPTSLTKQEILGTSSMSNNETETKDSFASKEGEQRRTKRAFGRKQPESLKAKSSVENADEASFTEASEYASISQEASKSERGMKPVESAEAREIESEQRHSSKAKLLKNFLQIVGVFTMEPPRNSKSFIDLQEESDGTFSKDGLEGQKQESVPLWTAEQMNRFIAAAEQLKAANAETSDTLMKSSDLKSSSFSKDKRGMNAVEEEDIAELMKRFYFAVGLMNTEVSQLDMAKVSETSDAETSNLIKRFHRAVGIMNSEVAKLRSSYQAKDGDTASGEVGKANVDEKENAMDLKASPKAGVEDGLAALDEARSSTDRKLENVDAEMNNDRKNSDDGSKNAEERFEEEEEDDDGRGASERSGTKVGPRGKDVDSPSNNPLDEQKREENSASRANESNYDTVGRRLSLPKLLFSRTTRRGSHIELENPKKSGDDPLTLESTATIGKTSNEVQARRSYSARHNLDSTRKEKFSESAETEYFAGEDFSTPPQNQDVESKGANLKQAGADDANSTEDITEEMQFVNEYGSAPNTSVSPPATTTTRLASNAVSEGALSLDEGLPVQKELNDATVVAETSNGDHFEISKQVDSSPTSPLVTEGIIAGATNKQSLSKVPRTIQDLPLPTLMQIQRPANASEETRKSMKGFFSGRKLFRNTANGPRRSAVRVSEAETVENPILQTRFRAVEVGAYPEDNNKKKYLEGKNKHASTKENPVGVDVSSGDKNDGNVTNPTTAEHRENGGYSLPPGGARSGKAFNPKKQVSWLSPGRLFRPNVRPDSRDKGRVSTGITPTENDKPEGQDTLNKDNAATGITPTENDKPQVQDTLDNGEVSTGKAPTENDALDMGEVSTGTIPTENDKPQVQDTLDKGKVSTGITPTENKKPEVQDTRYKGKVATATNSTENETPKIIDEAPNHTEGVEASGTSDYYQKTTPVPKSDTADDVEPVQDSASLEEATPEQSSSKVVHNPATRPNDDDEENNEQHSNETAHAQEVESEYIQEKEDPNKNPGKKDSAERRPIESSKKTPCCTLGPKDSILDGEKDSHSGKAERTRGAEPAHEISLIEETSMPTEGDIDVAETSPKPSEQKMAADAACASPDNGTAKDKSNEPEKATRNDTSGESPKNSPKSEEDAFVDETAPHSHTKSGYFHSPRRQRKAKKGKKLPRERSTEDNRPSELEISNTRDEIETHFCGRGPGLTLIRSMGSSRTGGSGTNSRLNESSRTGTDSDDDANFLSDTWDAAVDLLGYNSATSKSQDETSHFTASKSQDEISQSTPANAPLQNNAKDDSARSWLPWRRKK